MYQLWVRIWIFQQWEWRTVHQPKPLPLQLLKAVEEMDYVRTRGVVLYNQKHNVQAN